MKILAQKIYLRGNGRNHNDKWGNETGKRRKPVNGILMTRCCCEQLGLNPNGVTVLNFLTIFPQRHKDTEVLSNNFHPTPVGSRLGINSWGLPQCHSHRLRAFLLHDKALNRETQIFKEKAFGVYKNCPSKAAGGLQGRLRGYRQDINNCYNKWIKDWGSKWWKEWITVPDRTSLMNEISPRWVKWNKRKYEKKRRNPMK